MASIPELMIGETGTALVDAYSTYGVRMSDSFLDNLYAPPTMKEYITNESRLMNGTEILFPVETKKGKTKEEDEVVEIHKVASREVNLSFRVLAGYALVNEEARKDLIAKRNAFYDLLSKQRITICLRRESGTPTFRLIYTGKSTKHSMNMARTSCEITAKFIEFDPTDRLPKEEDGIDTNKK